MPAQTIQAGIEPAQRSMLFGFNNPQNRGTQRRTECQRVDRGKQYRRGNRHRELLINFTDNSADESDRHKDGEQHQRGGNDRAGNLLHGFDGRGFVVETLGFHQIENAFNYNNGIVHQQTNGEDQTEQRQRVNAVAERHEHCKGGAKRNRNGQRRHHRGTPVLKKDVADTDDEQNGDQQGENNFIDTDTHEIGGIVRQDVFHVGGESLAQRLEFGPQGIHGFQRVGIRRTAHADRHGHLPVKFGAIQIIFGSLFDTGDIFKINHGAVRTGAHHNVFKVRRVIQTAFSLQRVRYLTVSRNAADRADRSLDVLLLDGGGHFSRTDSQSGQPAGIHPDAHAVFRPVHLSTADTGNALKRRFNNFVDVVAQKQLIAGSARRTDHDETEHICGLGLYRNTLLGHFRWQQRLGLSHTVLHLDLRHIGVGADSKAHRQLVAARTVGRRRHINHVVHAIDCIFDRAGNSCRQNFRTGTGIKRMNDHLRRSNLRILRDRQREHRKNTGQHQHNGNHTGKTRAFNKNPGNHYLSSA